MNRYVSAYVPWHTRSDVVLWTLVVVFGLGWGIHCGPDAKFVTFMGPAIVYLFVVFPVHWAFNEWLSRRDQAAYLAWVEANPLPPAVETKPSTDAKPTSNGASRSRKKTPAITSLTYLPGTVEPEPERFHLDQSCAGLAFALTKRGLGFSQPDAAGPPDACDETHREYSLNNRAVLISKDRDFRDMHDAGAEHAGMVLAPHDMDFESIAEFCTRVAKELSK